MTYLKQEMILAEVLTDQGANTSHPAQRNFPLSSSPKMPQFWVHNLSVLAYFLLMHMYGPETKDAARRCRRTSMLLLVRSDDKVS